MSNTANEELIEIQAEYVYLTIPAKWVCVYHKLLMYMADYGKTIIDDCSAICKNSNKNILSCWNLFQSALACHTLGKNKEADLFIKYIEKQLAKINDIPNISEEEMQYMRTMILTMYANPLKNKINVV